MLDQELGAKAREFARRYVALTKELKKEGVPEGVAREDARRTALDMMFEIEHEGDPCPLCGRSCACTA